MSQLNRRNTLAAVASLPALAVPIVTSAAAGPDPIFAAIEKHRQIWAEHGAVYNQIDQAEWKIREGKIDKHRPYGLVAWRNYSHIGGSEIDRVREEFLEQAVADRETIEREYREKKAEHRAALRAEREWDRRNGLAPLRVRLNRLGRAGRTAEQALSEIAPTSVAGAAALVDYVRRDIEDFADDDRWYVAALANVAEGLKVIAVETPHQMLAAPCSARNIDSARLG